MKQVAEEALRSKAITQGQYDETMASLEANPCNGVDRALSEATKAEWAPVIATHEAAKSVDVLQAFRLDRWHIIYVNTGMSDPPYLFYSDSPLKSKPLGLWSGAAMIFETRDVEKWVVENIPGVPLKLAQCFAWHVTLNPN